MWKNIHCSVGILLVIASSLLLTSNVTATSWAYSFVVWDGYMYVVSDEYVEEVGNEIGQVTRYSDMEQYAGNFSNAYEKGTKYYSIENVSTDTAIAVQESAGRYRKAVREGEYAYAENRTDFFWLVIGFFLFVIITSVAFSLLKRKY